MVALGSEKVAVCQVDESHGLTRCPDSFPLFVSPSHWDYKSPFYSLALGYLLAQMRKLLCPLVSLLMWLKLSTLGVEVESNCLGFYFFIFLVLNLYFIQICRTESFSHAIMGMSMQPLCLWIHPCF